VYPCESSPTDLFVPFPLQEMFEAQYRAIKAVPNTYYIIVVEDTAANQIVANGTIVLERKFTHSTGIVGHLEDIVVDSKYRGQQLGKMYICGFADHVT